jgi:hypothetical protein
MKNFLVLLLVSAFVVPAFARSITVTGYGREIQLCNAGPIGDSCIRQVKDRTEKSGIRDADLQCQLKQGQSLLYTAYCYSSCYPNYIPPDNAPTTVRCDATCTMQCEL